MQTFESFNLNPLGNDINVALDTSSPSMGAPSAHVSPVYKQHALEPSLAPEGSPTGGPNPLVTLNQLASQFYLPTVPEQFFPSFLSPPRQPELQAQYFNAPYVRTRQDFHPGSAANADHDDSKREQPNAQEQETARLQPMGACARCKSLKVRCEFRNDGDTCKRCATAGQECVIPGRRLRRAPPKREHLLNQIREQAKQIQELMATIEALKSPAVARSSESPRSTIHLTMAKTMSCDRCRRLKVRCEFRSDSDTCKRCTSPGVECVVPGRKPRRTLPGGRQQLLSQAREQAEQIQELTSIIELLNSPGQSSRSPGSTVYYSPMESNSEPPLPNAEMQDWISTPRILAQINDASWPIEAVGAALHAKVEHVEGMQLRDRRNGGLRGGGPVDGGDGLSALGNGLGLYGLAVAKDQSNSGMPEFRLVPIEPWGQSNDGLWIGREEGAAVDVEDDDSSNVEGGDGGSEEDKDDGPEVMNGEQNMGKGKRTVSILTADMFELAALRAHENAVQEHQRKLFRDLEDEGKHRKEREAKKRIQNQDNGNKKKKQKLVEEEVRTVQLTVNTTMEAKEQAHEEVHKEERIWPMSADDLSAHITRDGEFPVAAGGFADIYQGTLHVPPTEIKVALKVIKVYSADDNHVKKDKRLRREIKVWMKLKHANVLSLIGTASGFGPFPAMVCPWLENGTLTSYLECCGGGLEIHHILTLIHDVASGLQYLHSMSIVHGDLSGSNVLVCANGGACIADFGLSTVLDEIGSTFATTTGKPRGTLRWAAPELLDLVDHGDAKTQHTGPTVQSDVYSFGGIMVQILSGKVPYHYYPRDVQIVAAMFRGETPARPDDLRVTDLRWEFIQRCWSPFRNVSQRPSSKEIVAFSADDLRMNSSR